MRSRYLTVQSPSTTAISYTVSDIVLDSSKYAKIGRTLALLFRLILFVLVLLVDVETLQRDFTLPLFAPAALRQHEGRLLHFPLPAFLSRDWRVIAVISPLLLYMCLKRGYTGSKS